MALVSSPIITNTIIHRTTSQFSHANPAYAIHKISMKITANNSFGNFSPTFSCQPVIQRRHREMLVGPLFGAKDSPEGAGGGDDQQDPRASETVMKLYKAMKNKDAVELSEIIADEPQVVGNLSPIIKSLQGGKQVLAFCLGLIRHLGNDIEFIVRPTLHDGTNVGLHWGFEWRKTHSPFGKGFSFQISHHYKMKVIIKNVETFIEPLLHSSLRMKMMELVTTLMEKMNSIAIFKGGASKVVSSSLLLVFITAAFIITLMLIKH